MAQTPNTPNRINLARLPAGEPMEFRLEPDAATRDRIAADLELLALKKLRFVGRLLPQGKRDWRLEAELGATVVQPCVVTLAPVTSRIDESVARVFLAHMPELPEGHEIEMPEDDSVEPLPEVLDLETVMTEALALALPLYPRASEAELGDTAFTEPGTRPMTDEDTKPFAGLADLMKKKDED